jgi:hypothetical protein
MNQTQVDYAALRFKTAKDLSSVANDVKSGRVLVENVYVERLGKRILKFRCPPGTNRGGKWTDRLGTDCHLGAARAGLAKIGRQAVRLGDAVDDAAERRSQGGPGLLRYQAGRGFERAGEIVDYLAENRKKKPRPAKPSRRERLGRALERAGDRVDERAARRAEPKPAKPAKPARERKPKPSDDEVMAPPRAEDQMTPDRFLDDILAAHRAKTPKRKKPEVEPEPEPTAEPLPPPKPGSMIISDEVDGPAEGPLPPPKPGSAIIPDEVDDPADLPASDGEGAGYPADKPDLFAPPQGAPVDLPAPGDEGKLPTPETTVVKKPKKGKKPSGPAQAAQASLDDANAKNAKKTGKKLPGKQFGTAFKIEANAKKWAKQTALTESINIFVAKGPDGKFRIFDEERFLASGHESAYAFNYMGNRVDPPSTEIYPDATPEQIVEDVTNSVEEDQKLAEQFVEELSNPAPPLELKKSKTGNFLPDDFNRESLGYGQTAFAGATAEMIAFEAAWDKQQEDVLAFWEKRIGPINDAMDGLDAINAHIAEESAKDKANSGKIGVLNAERNNYLAMIVPNAPDEDAFVDPYERINFVGPKRRHQIIDDAGLDEFIVSSKKTKKANKDLTQPVGDDEITPELAIVSDPTKNPASQVNNALDKEGVGGKAKKLADEIKANGYADFKADDGKLDSNKFEAEMDQAESDFETAYHAAVSDVTSGQGVSKKRLDDLVEKQTKYDALKRAKYDFYTQVNLENQEDDELYDVVDDAPEISLEDQNNDLILTTINDSNAYYEADQIISTWGDYQSIPKFDDKDSLTAWFDSQILAAEKQLQEELDVLEKLKKTKKLTTDDVLNYRLLPEHKKQWWEDRKEKALHLFDVDQANTVTEMKNSALEMSQVDDSMIYAVQFDEGTGSNAVTGTALAASKEFIADLAKAVDGDLFYKGKKISLDEANALVAATQSSEVEPPSIDDLPDATPEPLTPIDFGKAGHEAALQTLFDQVEEFDYFKIVNHEGQSLGTTLASIINRVKNKPYAKQANEFLKNLPENLPEMSPEEQLAAIRQATGASNNLQAAKFLARAAYNAQFGSPESLESLQLMLKAHAGDITDAEKQAILAKDFTSSIEQHTEQLENVLAKLYALSPDAAPTLKDLYRGRVNDARNRLVADLIGEHLKARESGDLSQMASSGKALAKHSAQLDLTLKAEAETILNSGITIVPGNPNSLSGKESIVTVGFDSTLLGTMQGNGRAISYSIPVGHKGLWMQADADDHVRSGGNLADVPDAYLREAIFNNMGVDQRFAKIDDGSIQSGYNDLDKTPDEQTTGVIDTATGKRYVFKRPDRDHLSHVQEVAMARLSQVLGNPSTGIRLGSEPISAPLAADRAKQEGTETGINRWIVSEHVGNLFDGEGYEVLGHLQEIGELPDGATLDGVSLARLMVLDRTSNYYDRKAGNIIAVKGPDGKVHLHPIDHPNAFRDFAGSDEQAAGFIQPGKKSPHQLKLISLAKSLEGPERERFAQALVDSVKRFKKADFDSIFGEIGTTMNLSDVEKARLSQHAKYLAAKREALDWDKMTVTALSNLGFSGEEIAGLQAGPAFAPGTYAPGFGIPEQAGRVSTIGKRVDSSPKRAAYVVLNYGGAQIEGMEVRTQLITFRGPKDGPEVPAKEAVQMLFKRRGSALDVDVTTDPTWKKIPKKGHIAASHPRDANGVPIQDETALWHVDMKDPEWVTGTRDMTGSSHQTYYKQLDDGTIVTVTRGTGQLYGGGPDPDRATANNTVRIIMPGKGEDITPERVTKAMEAAGVTEHGDPTDDQIREYGIAAMYAAFFGYVPANASSGQLINKISDEYGITEEMFETRVTANGKLSAQLTEEGWVQLAKKTDVRTIDHTGASALPTLKSVILQGELLSTQRRFEHGPDKSGQSSAEDMAERGSGDLVYTHKYGYEPTQMSYGPGRVFFPAEVLLRRTDWHAFPGDYWGDVKQYKPASTGLTAYHQREVTMKGAIDISHGIIVVEPLMRDTLIAYAIANGRAEINGVPIEDIIVTSGQAKEAMGKVVERWRSEQ